MWSPNTGLCGHDSDCPSRKYTQCHSQVRLDDCHVAVRRQGRGQNLEMPGSRKFWEARYLIIGLTIRKPLCKHIEAMDWSKWFRNSTKLFLWTPIVWYLIFDHEVATSDFNANEPNDLRDRYYYNAPPLPRAIALHRSRRSFDLVSDFAPKNLKVGSLFCCRNGNQISIEAPRILQICIK